MDKSQHTSARITQGFRPRRPLSPFRRVQRPAIGAHVFVRDLHLLFLVPTPVVLVGRYGDPGVASDEHGACVAGADAHRALPFPVP